MGGTCLDRLAVLDHRLDAVSAHGAGKALTLRLLAADHGNRKPLAGKGLVDTEHLLGLLDGLLLGLMGRVSLLPEKLGGAEKETGT